MTGDDPNIRSSIMRAVKSKNTSPELKVRRLLHSRGFRYRLHYADLPGKPDIVFPARKKVVFVHGCFWHGHDCPRGRRIPKTNTDYWLAKVNRNRVRDQTVKLELGALGWSELTLWECQLKTEDWYLRCRDFLSQID